MRFETIHPRELGAEESASWRTLLRGGLTSPYLTPEWAQIIGAVRDDARVCIIDGGGGFLAVQKLSRYSAMGLGAPIADYQGIVAKHGLHIDAGMLCKALKVGRIDLTHVPVGQSSLSFSGGAGSWIAETSNGTEAYEAIIKSRRPEFVRQINRKTRKMARDRGHIEFRAESHVRKDFETLLAWKDAQHSLTGQPRIWTKPWVRAALEACFHSHERVFSGTLFTLTVNNSTIAGAFGLRSERVLHLWILAHNRDFDAYSPGVQLVRRIIAWACENSVSEVDLGPGDYQFKRQVSTKQRWLERGVIAGRSVSGSVARSVHALCAGIERLPTPALAALPGKAIRRLDVMRALAVS